MMQIGTMQGRLLPPLEGRFQCFPRDGWAEEFPRAKQAGLSAIEWIYDLYGANVNPLATDEGIEKVKFLSAEHDIKVRSLCADYFMDKPLLRVSAVEQQNRIEQLCWLLQRCRLLPINHIVLPFVDISKIESPAEVKEVAEIIGSVVEVAADAAIELHLETSLPPEEFATLLRMISHPSVKVNYDSGNSASLGYNVRDEFHAYGERIGSVHIKDRIRGGGTVPLGSGGADLPALFDELKKVGYLGDFILQVARGTEGEEVAWTRHNRDYVQKHWLNQIKPEFLR
jgi:hexulose-6-phosphate isomerase